VTGVEQGAGRGQCDAGQRRSRAEAMRGVGGGRGGGSNGSERAGAQRPCDRNSIKFARGGGGAAGARNRARGGAEGGGGAMCARAGAKNCATGDRLRRDLFTPPLLALSLSRGRFSFFPYLLSLRPIWPPSPVVAVVGAARSDEGRRG
jgi:hypothetical protein